MWLSVIFLAIFSLLLFLVHKPERRYSNISTYYRKIRIELSAVKYRRDGFSQVVTGELLEIKPDPTREYNVNAVGAYTQNGKLLGYIPRSQRRLINLFREHPASLAIVYKKFHKGSDFRILIDVFLPRTQTRMTLARNMMAPSSSRTPR